MGIRPEHLDVVPPGGNGWDVRVDTFELLGAERLIYASLGNEQLIVRVEEGSPTPRHGDMLHVVPRQNRLHWFDASTGKRL